MSNLEDRIQALERMFMDELQIIKNEIRSTSCSKEKKEKIKREKLTSSITVNIYNINTKSPTRLYIEKLMHDTENDL